MMNMKLTTRTINLALCLGLLTAGTLITGCASTNPSAQYGRSAKTYQNDKTIQHQVLKALKNNPQYKYGAVSVNVYSGDVQLSGFVDTTPERTAAGEIAGHVQGVHTVTNNIQVRSPGQNN